MKRILLLQLISAFSICLYSCNKEENIARQSPDITGKGALLFWTDNPAKFTTCGPTILVTLSNGSQSVITNHYATPPIGCADYFGGSFELPAGDYGYVISSVGGCTPDSGFASVDTGACTLIKLL